MSYVAGIDFSTHAIDVVLIDENGELPCKRVQYMLDGQDAWERARNVASTSRFSWVEDTIAIGIEDPRGKNAGALYRVQGAILTRIPLSLLVCPLVPSQWRKLARVPGNASKEVVREAAIRLGANPLWGRAFDPYDAFCIAFATRTLIQNHSQSEEEI